MPPAGALRLRDDRGQSCGCRSVRGTGGELSSRLPSTQASRADTGPGVQVVRPAGRSTWTPGPAPAPRTCGSMADGMTAGLAVATAAESANCERRVGGPVTGDRICAFEGCEKRILSRGYCSGHYQQLTKGRELKPLRRSYEPICSVTGCTKPHASRGFCSTHYAAAVRDDRRKRVAAGAVQDGDICRANCCVRVADVAGYCSSHYNQLRKHGSTDRPIGEYRSSKRKTNESGERYCSSCSLWLHVDEFPTRNGNRELRSAYCRMCHTLRRHNITRADYNRILSCQDFKCAVCGAQTSDSLGRSFHVDHDHSCCNQPVGSCGRCIRGLLCSSCNKAAGMLGDSAERALALSNYLRRTPIPVASVRNVQSSDTP
ncbi:endonuclease domain-containing protein [Streptomyces sp. NPDC032472]|uniref:endonuclease domain-containing protein n=1 Tax=Streptomyces sp. NPDC032472 TaxID=3155018 RepID=UPI0034062E35